MPIGNRLYIIKAKNRWLGGLQIKHYISKGGEENGDIDGAGCHGLCDHWDDWHDKRDKPILDD